MEHANLNYVIRTVTRGKVVNMRPVNMQRNEHCIQIKGVPELMTGSTDKKLKDIGAEQDIMKVLNFPETRSTKLAKWANTRLSQQGPLQLKWIT